VLADFISIGDITYCKSVSIAAAPVCIRRSQHGDEDTFLYVSRAFLAFASHNCVQVPKNIAMLESEVCLRATQHFENAFWPLGKSNCVYFSEWEKLIRSIERRVWII